MDFKEFALLALGKAVLASMCVNRSVNRSAEISSAFNIVMIIFSFCPKMVAKPGVVVSSVTSQFE